MDGWHPARTKTHSPTSPSSGQGSNHAGMGSGVEGQNYQKLDSITVDRFRWPAAPKYRLVVGSCADLGNLGALLADVGSSQRHPSQQRCV
jgi:hypothetical protein